MRAECRWRDKAPLGRLMKRLCKLATASGLPLIAPRAAPSVLPSYDGAQLQLQ